MSRSFDQIWPLDYPKSHGGAVLVQANVVAADTSTQRKGGQGRLRRTGVANVSNIYNRVGERISYITGSITTYPNI